MSKNVLIEILVIISSMPCLSLIRNLYKQRYLGIRTICCKKYTYTLVFFELPEVAVNAARDCLREGLFPTPCC